MIKLVAASVFLMLLAGCSSTQPHPGVIGGNYYMGGDEACSTYDQVTPTRIRCYAKKGGVTGFRDALTPQQVQSFNSDQAQPQQAQLYDPNYQLKSNTYRPAAVQQVTPVQSQTQVRCISTGIYTNCRQY